MKFNGRSPLSIVKSYGTFAERVSEASCKHNGIKYNLTPIMGWSDLAGIVTNESELLEQAKLLVDKGFSTCGYNYFIASDSTNKGLEYYDGKMYDSTVSDVSTKINDNGLKFGLSTHSFSVFDNNDRASFYEQIIKDGVELYNFKYDKVHFVLHNAIVVKGMTLIGENTEYPIDLASAKLSGMAKVRKKSNCKWLVGLDSGRGLAEYNVEVADSGQYTLRIESAVLAKMNKALLVGINGNVYNMLYEPKADMRGVIDTTVQLNKGNNRIVLCNPISNAKDQVVLLSDKVSENLKNTVINLIDNGECQAKPVAVTLDFNGKFGIEEWAGNVCNSWTIGDRKIFTWSDVKRAYEKAIKVQSYNKVGSYAYLGALCMSELTTNQQKTQFSLWCMLNSPLIIASDLRYIASRELDILQNSRLIAINQDKLCKSAKRINAGKLDLLAKPLMGGDVAVCVFNKTNNKSFFNYAIDLLINDEYIGLLKSNKYVARELWSDREEIIEKSLCDSIDGNSVKVYILSQKND